MSVAFVRLKIWEKTLDGDEDVAKPTSLSEYCYQMSKEKGFYDDEPEEWEWEDNILLGRIQYSASYLGNKLMLIVTELAEAHEALRHNNPPSEHIPEFSALEEEMADTIIRIMDFCGYLNLRIEEAIAAKLEYNS